jgi:ATP/maltotriose-dependent transcriptional regulator MalT
LRQLLEAQQKRIRETLDKAAQQPLQFSDEEKRQVAAEHAHQRKRLGEIDRELVDEPKRLEGTYAVHARRLEVLGVVYLWPVKG